MQKHTKRQVKVNFKKDTFISDVCHLCLCVISDQTEMAKEKECLSYFPSRARLNFPWIFKEFDLKSKMKGFFENFLALSVKKLKKVLMILPSINGCG